ncbi:ribokinase [Planctomyces sp. SH-PL62]|uniref:ribokinase n=1 Tax=Planctomyces sp. SH-PL62 TaxID=1636152 RepID=UPI00078E8A7A|nr:ribokinase [Planctomyces sp. SH-PL62]AMV40107.1 Ribokinase [Planctomyces sp. SH-PL62]
MSRILLFGSSNTDMTVRVPRLPAPGETVLGGEFATTPGGKGANQAVAARRAGAEVVFVTAVGDDELGRGALALYRREGIDVEHVRVVSGVASGVALIYVDDHGENMIAVASGANLSLTPEDVAALPDDLFQAGDILVTGLEIPYQTALAAMRRGRAAGMTVLLNPAPAPTAGDPAIAELLAAADVVTPNRGEARTLAGAGKGDDPLALAERIRPQGPKTVIVTLGSEGCLATTGPEVYEIPSRKVTAVDAVGAGDAFNGALAAVLAEGRPLGEALAWATAAAALAVTRPGAQSALPTREAIDRFVHVKDRG